jgi:hypothetical protein
MSMGVYIKGMEMPEKGYRLILIHADGTVQSTDGEMTAIPVTEPHGRLIDADEFLKRAIGTKCFRDDFALMLEELVGESTTIIQSSKEE